MTNTGNVLPPFDREKLKLLKALRHRTEHQCPYVTAGENHQGQEDSSTYRSASHQAPMGATIFPTVPYTTNLVFLPLTCVPVSPGFQHHSASYMSSQLTGAQSLGSCTPTEAERKGYLSTSTNWCFLMITRKAVEAPVEQLPLTVHLSSHHILTNGPGLASLLPQQPSSVWAPLLRCPSSTWTRCLHNSPLTPPPV